MGIIVVSLDADDSGALSFDELKDHAYGVAYVFVGYSDTAFIPAPTGFDSLFVEGIAQGIAPYRIIETASFDDLGLTMPSDVFDLNMCPYPPGACSPPFANIF